MTKQTARMLLVAKSRNRKTGTLPAIYRTQDTCPTTCPLMGAGCYGENNGPGGSCSPFGHAERGDEARDTAALARMLYALPAGTMIRANVVGDYLMPDGTPDFAYISVLNTAAITYGIRILSYTHAWRAIPSGTFATGARPQASCESPDDVREARAAGYTAVIVAPDADTYPNGTDIGGSRAVLCPNVTTGITCRDCGLCSKQRRSTVVLPVHGARKRAASASVTA